MPKGNSRNGWLSQSRRRQYLKALTVGLATGLAGCSQESNNDETEPESESQPEKVNGLTYMAPREADDFDSIVEERKLAALKQVLAVDEVGSLVKEAVSTTAYHRIFQDYDFIEILAPHGMTVSGTWEDDTQEVEFSDIKQITALVSRENDKLVQLNTQTRESHVINRSNEELNKNTVNAALNDSRIANVLEDKDWYVIADDYSIITAYSEEYPIGEVTPVIFNWNSKDTERASISPAVTTETFGSEAEGNEILDIYEPTQKSPDPLSDIVDEVEGNDPGNYREGAIDAPGKMDDTDWKIRRPDQTIEQNGWEVTWENTLHDAYQVTANYNGKPVLGKESKVPYMLSDYEPFGMESPGVPAGRRNFHFWDTLGFTGPGVIEKHDFSDGFRIRGSYHTGSVDHWEWRFGQNYGPYRYIIDWNFHEDGTIDITSRHPTTGYRTTNGYPKYTFHLAVEPAFDSATVSVNDGNGWNQTSRETRVDNDSIESLRVENVDGPEQLVVTRPGDRNYALQYDPEITEYDQTVDGVVDEMINDKEYLNPDNYVRDRSIDNEHVYLRMFKSRDTGEGTHATTDPFAFRYTIKTENY